MAGAPEGNENAKKGALYNHALKRALARAGKTVDGGLNKVTDQLVAAAIAGEQWAIKEVADRIEGKPAQTNILAGDQDNPVRIQEIARRIIDADTGNSDS